MENDDNDFEPPLMFVTDRFYVFARKFPKIIKEAAGKENVGNVSEIGLVHTHISNSFTFDEVYRLISSDDMVDTDAFRSYSDELEQEDDDEFSFDDYDIGNSILDKFSDKRNAFAQILAFSDSFRGTVQAIAYWISNQVDIDEMIEQEAGRSNPVFDPGVRNAIEDVLAENVSTLLPEDVNDTITMIIGLWKSTASDR